MATTGRSAAGKLLRWSGGPSVLRTLARQRPTILSYHDPTPEVLDEHLRYLGGRYQFSTLDEVVDALGTGNLAAIPDRSLVITIDDGHRGNYDLIPVFERHAVRPTIYLCSAIVGTDRRFWFNDAGDDAQRLKTLPHDRRLADHERATGFRPESRCGETQRDGLSRDEIQEMKPFVDFGSHTRFHPILVRCEDEEARREIAESKGEIEALVGRPCRHFAFPNGDYGEREVEMIRTAGYASARTCDLGWVGPESDPFRLPSFGAADDASVDILSAQASGLSTYLRRAAQGEWRGRWPTTPLARDLTSERT